MKRWTISDAMDIVNQRAFDEQRWRIIQSMLRMAEVGLFRDRSICVRWTRPKRPHGDRRYKAAMRMINEAWRRQMADAKWREEQRGVTLVGVRWSP